MKFSPCLTLFAVASIVAGCNPHAEEPAPEFTKKHVQPYTPAVVSTAPVSKWNPPTSGKLVEFGKAAQFLLEHGMADPRRGRFVLFSRHIFVFPGAETVTLKNVSAYGWQVTADGQQRLITIDGAICADGTKATPADVSEIASVSSGASFADPWIFAAQLLIVGREKDAEAVLGPEPVSEAQAMHYLASDFLNAEWEQACLAFQHGDDRGAHNIATALLSLEPAYRGFARRNAPAAAPSHTPSPSSGSLASWGDRPSQIWFDFDAAKRLALDSSERLKRPINHATIFGAPEFIDSLTDSGYVAGDGFPPNPLIVGGRPNLSWSAEQTTDFIDSLLACARKDERLTRQIVYNEGAISIVPVKDLALRILYQVSEVKPDEAFPASPRPLEQLEAWWTRNKPLSPQVRLLAVLGDDGASPACWAAAAEWEVGVGEGAISPAYRTDVNQGAARLRTQAPPTLLRLLAKRAVDCLSSPIGSQQDVLSRFESAATIAMALQTVSPTAARPTINTVVSRFGASANSDSVKAVGYQQVKHLASALQSAIEGGSPADWKPYSRLLMDIDQNAGYPAPPAFDFLYTRREQPEAQQLAVALLRESLSHPKPADEYDRTGLYSRPMRWLNQPIEDSPLLSSPTVQAAVLKALQDKTAIGSMFNDSRGVNLSFTQGWPRAHFDHSDGNTPRGGASWPYRKCDRLMEDLVQLKGAPKFQPFWSTDAKDAAAKQFAALIASHKNDELALLDQTENWTKR